MDSYVVTILPGGRITIPVAIRKDLDLNPGDTLEYWRDGHEVYFRKAEADEPASVGTDTDDSKAPATPRSDAK